MPTPEIRSAAGVLAGAAAVLRRTPAYPHAVCGDRIFPATLAIDAGVIAQLDLFTDDIFPDSLGKPIFSQSLPMFTGARQ